MKIIFRQAHWGPEPPCEEVNFCLVGSNLLPIRSQFRQILRLNRNYGRAVKLATDNSVNEVPT